MITKSLKQFIWEKCEQKGYVLDKELAKFCGGEPNYYMAGEYQRQFFSLKKQIEYFASFINPNSFISSYKNTGYKYAKTRYSLSDTKWDNRHYKITKDYFNYLKEKGIKVNS